MNAFRLVVMFTCVIISVVFVHVARWFPVSWCWESKPATTDSAVLSHLEGK